MDELKNLVEAEDLLVFLREDPAGRIVERDEELAVREYDGRRYGRVLAIVLEGSAAHALCEAAYDADLSEDPARISAQPLHYGPFCSSWVLPISPMAAPGWEPLPPEPQPKQPELFLREVDELLQYFRAHPDEQLCFFASDWSNQRVSVPRESPAGLLCSDVAHNGPQFGLCALVQAPEGELEDIESRPDFLEFVTIGWAEYWEAKLAAEGFVDQEFLDAINQEMDDAIAAGLNREDDE